MQSEIKLITPEMAAELLLSNHSNRPVTESQVRFFEDQLKNNSFSLTHQGIAVGKTGILLDGQHRLLAIVRTGIPTEMQFSTDLDDSAFAVIDTGYARLASQILAMSGTGACHTTTLASAVRLYMLYWLAPSKVWSGSMKIPSQDILRDYSKDPEGWNEVVQIASRNALAKILVPGSFACMCYLAKERGVSIDALRQLAVDLKHGAALPDGDPALAYRNRGVQMGTTNQQAKVSDYIKLLNARISGQKLKIFKAASFPPMPKVWSLK